MIKYLTLPLTELPPNFVEPVVEVFKSHQKAIETDQLEKGLTGNEVLAILRKDLEGLGFQVERGKSDNEKIFRPVFFGENGQPTLTYEVDAYHPDWRCGLEVEAGRAKMGNALYRDLIQGLLMVQVDYLMIAVPNTYKFHSGGKNLSSKDFDHACSLGRALYTHTRFRMPYRLVLIGY